MRRWIESMTDIKQTDPFENHIRTYKRFAKQCISEGIQKEHIPLLWHSYKIGEIDKDLSNIYSSLLGVDSSIDALNQGLFGIERAIYEQ